MTMRCDEEMIEVAVKHIGHDFLAEVSRDAADDCAASESFDKKMRALIGRKAARRTGRQALKVLSRVAAIFFVVVIVFSVAVLSSEALRAQVIHLLYQIGGDKAQISFVEIDPATLPEGMVVPDYLPDGYRFVEAKTEALDIVSRYENESGDEIKIRQGSLEMGISVSQDNTTRTEIAGRTAYVIDGGDVKVVIFSNDTNSFIITGNNTDVSQLLIMAESMLD